MAKQERHGLSSASIRNVMADLEEQGYLRQPHTSAGRVPTPAGYHFYIETLMRQRTVPAQHRRYIDSHLKGAAGNADEQVAATSQILSELTHQVGVVLIPAERLVREGVERALEALPGSGRAYVTIDIDVLDPSGAPGTGYPEPGGIGYYHLKDALQLVARRYDVAGFDLTEVDPVYDTAGVTSRIASKLLLDFLGAIFTRSR